MKNIHIKKIVLKNFKGLRSFSLLTDCCNTSVHGDNATGKTTLFDSFLWLLFNKDSQGKADFEVKTVDASGAVIHNLDHEVSAALSIDGTDLRLRKSMREKWTKKRGSAESEFTGHVTKYYVDDVPAKLKDFSGAVGDIVDEEAFRLLTDPKYFNSLHWQKRREILLSICGDISDQDVIKADKSLSELPEILGNRSIEDHKKVIADRRNEINKELKEIPARIDEADQSMPKIDDIDFEAIKKIIVEKKATESKIYREIDGLENGNADTAKHEKELHRLESEKYEIEKNFKREVTDRLDKLIRDRDDARRDFDNTNAKIDGIGSRIDEDLRTIQRLESECAELRNKWKSENARSFEPDHTGDTCPTCGQNLPADQIQAAIEKAAADFNNRKADELAKINAKGKEKKARIETLKAAIELGEAEISQSKDDAQKIKSNLAGKEHAIETLESEKPDFGDITAKIEGKKKEISDIKSGSDMAGKKAELKKQIDSIEAEIEAAQADLAKKDQADRINARISELESQESALASEFERLEHELYLTEQFTVAKVNLLESRVNSRFEITRWKLFEEQINGGIKECCEALHNGVPYGSMNNAARINVGLDIINVLSDHYGVSCPIFIDNAESVTRYIETKAQIIKLVVSEDHKTLTIEKEIEQCQMKKAS